MSHQNGTPSQHLLVSGFVAHRSDVASSMRLVNTDTKLRICNYLSNSSVPCTNDVALVAFSECRNRTA